MSKQLHIKIKAALQNDYRLSDAANKKYTLVYEFRPEKVFRNLKIEIRKEQSEFEWEKKIAFSKFAEPLRDNSVWDLTYPSMTGFQC